MINNINMNQTKLTKFFKIKSPRINDMNNFIQKNNQKIIKNLFKN